MRRGRLHLRRSACARLRRGACRAARAGTGVLLRQRLAVVALRPFGEDLVAILRRPVEIVLDQALLVVGGDEFERLRSCPASRRRRSCWRTASSPPASRASPSASCAASSFLVRLHDAAGLEVPAQPFGREDRCRPARRTSWSPSRGTRTRCRSGIRRRRPACTAASPSACRRAMFSCSASMNFHASCSPHIWIQPDDVEEAGARRRRDWASRSCPCRRAWSGPSTSSGLGRFCFCASTVLKQIAAP